MKQSLNHCRRLTRLELFSRPGKLDIPNKYNDNLIQSKYKMTIFTFGFLILFFNRDGQERPEQ